MYIVTSGYGSGSGSDFNSSFDSSFDSSFNSSFNSGFNSSFDSSYSNRNNYTTEKNRNMILLFILMGIALSFGICCCPLFHTKCSRLYYICNLHLKKINPDKDETEVEVEVDVEVEVEVEVEAET